MLVRTRGAAILMLSIGVLLIGCGDGPVAVSSTEVRSPDGEWRAVAQTLQTSGPGTNWVETRVHIERGGSLDLKSIDVLNVEDAGQTLGLTMKWLAPSHLLIVLKDDPHLVDYQVVKASGVQISLRYDK